MRVKGSSASRNKHKKLYSITKGFIPPSLAFPVDEGSQLMAAIISQLKSFASRNISLYGLSPCLKRLYLPVLSSLYRSIAF